MRDCFYLNNLFAILVRAGRLASVRIDREMALPVCKNQVAGKAIVTTGVFAGEEHRQRRGPATTGCFISSIYFVTSISLLVLHRLAQRTMRKRGASTVSCSWRDDT